MIDIYLRKAQLHDSVKLGEAFLYSANVLSPWSYPPIDIEKYITETHVFLLCAKDSDDFMGVFTLSGVMRGLFHSAYLGYNSFAPYQGKGYMSKGLLLLLEEAFERMNLHRLEANIQPDNHHSIALVAKAGFKKEGYSPEYLQIGGIWRDHERWAILNKEWHES